jgi:hypothetical protein
MRGFVLAGRIPRMVRPTVTALAVTLAACNSPQYEIWMDGQAKFASTGEVVSTGADATSGAPGNESGEGDETTGGESASVANTDVTTDVTTATDTGDAADTGDATDTDDSPPVVDPDRPVIVSIDLPDEVYAAGPVALSVQTKSTGAARVMLDGADAGTLIDAGDGLFKGELPVLGAIDNGPHSIEVIATAGPYEARKPDGFEVKAPKPGTEAWSQAGPAGSRTNRVAVTPERDLIEGSQTELGGVPQPTIRKRSGVNGDELWTVVLDTREGAVVDVAVLPDGRMWVAMNVREPMKDSRPRIALLDADGHAHGRRCARHRRPRRPRDSGRRERRLLRRGRRGRDGRLGLRLLADRRGGRADARRRVRLPSDSFGRTSSATWPATW